MLAARNKYFRIGLMIAAAAYLIAAAGEIVDANRIIGLDGVPRGYVISSALIPAAQLVGAAGLAWAAVAFGREIDWRRLRLAATILASVHLAYAAALVVRMATTLSLGDAGRYGTAEILAALGAGLNAAAICTIAFGLADARRGQARAILLRWAALIAVVGSLAIPASQLVLQSYYSDLGAVHQGTTGLLVGAVGSFVLAAGALFLARSVRRPLGRREAGVIGAAVLGAVGTLCVAGGEALIAALFDATPDSAVAVAHWLGVAQRAVFAGLFVCIALGARTAAESAPEPVEP